MKRRGHANREKGAQIRMLRPFCPNQLSKPLFVKVAFRGGTTNAAKLLHQVEEEEKIRHMDTVSLYPTVNKHEEYPIGHP